MTMRSKLSLGIFFCALSGGISGLSQPASPVSELRSTAIQADAQPAVLQAASSQRFRLDSSQSKFIAHTIRGGLLWFKGQEHLVAAQEFSGEVMLTPAAITPASLQLTVKTDSMVETSDAFTEAQKQIINGELREIVLEPEKYPEIVFRSTAVKGKVTTTNQYDVKIAGDLTLHGVTRRIEIPAKVTVTGNDLRAVGEFSIDRIDFKVKATSAFHGMVRVRNKVKFTFDIVGHRIGSSPTVREGFDRGKPSLTVGRLPPMTKNAHQNPGED